MIDHPDLVKDWKYATKKTDGCTTGILKPLTRWFLNKIGKPRNYKCLCAQHDFDYEFGPKYGTTRFEADLYLVYGIECAGHPLIAKAVFCGLMVCGWYAWNNYRREENA